MTLPVPPSARLILENGISTLREIILPALTDDWARFNANLMIGSLECALYSLDRDRALEHRHDLAAVLERLRSALHKSQEVELIAALEEKSPFDAASNLLIWSQNYPGPLASVIQKVLHDELFRQLDEEVEASEPMKGAFAAGLAGAA